MTTIRWMTANVQDNPDLSRANVKKCGVIIGSHVKPGAILFGQEIREDQDHSDVSAGLGHGWHEHGKNQTADPIWIQTGVWTLCTEEDMRSLGLGFLQPERIVTTHGGFAGISPHRQFHYIFMKFRQADGKIVYACFVNSHFVSAGWSLKPTKQRAWRREKWTQHWNKMNAMVNDVQSHGVPVFVGGDWNRPSPTGIKKFHSTQKWIYGSGLDRLAYIPAQGYKISVSRKFSFPTPSDHKCKGADLLIVKT